MQSIKCFVIGDNEVEIASLLISYTKGSCPDNHPTMFCEYPRTVMLNGEPYSLGLYHITGLEDYPRLRPLSYAGTDVFLVCFSVVSPSTYENVIEMWVPEINHYCPNTPFLLVGTQIDLRDDSTTLEKLAKNKQCPLNPEDGEKLAQELKAVKYLECSAKTQKGLKEVFDEAILAALEEEDGLEGAQSKKCRMCCVLL